MGGAKNAYRAFQEVRRADTPNQGLSDRQEPRQPPAKPICTEQTATRLVGVVDRRCHSDGGLGFSPDGFRSRSRRDRNRGGSVVLEIGEQKHARDFEAAKEQCRIDNPMSNGTIRYRIVQKQGFCLCLPQAQFGLVQL